MESKSTPTVLSNSSLTNSQDPEWVARGLAFWTDQLTRPTSRKNARHIEGQVAQFRIWAIVLGIEVAR